MATQEETLYHVLQVEPSASAKDIRKAYIRRMKKVHPDVSNSRDATEEAQRLNEAYSVLYDSARRAEYDRTLAAEGVSAKGASRRRRPPPRDHSQRPPPRGHSESPPTESARPSRRPTRVFREVDVTMFLCWVGLASVLAFTLGYFIGFRAAQPVLMGFFGLLGLMSVAIGVVLMTVLFIRRPRWKWLPLGWLWWLLGRLWSPLARLRPALGWLRPAVGDRRKTLIWTGCGVVFGGVLFGVFGYAVGFSTAQFIYDLLSLIGIMAFATLLIGGAILLVIMLIKGSRDGGYRGSGY